MKLQPLVHVTDMPAQVAFYESLGATVVSGSREGDFVLLELAGAEIGLLAHPPNPEQGGHTVELNFAAPDLDQVRRDLIAGGLADVPEPTAEGFGRQLAVTSPDGLLIKINELDDTLYG